VDVGNQTPSSLWACQERYESAAPLNKFKKLYRDEEGTKKAISMVEMSVRSSGRFRVESSLVDGRAGASLSPCFSGVSPEAWEQKVRCFMFWLAF
jgi:hypothetical protein